MKTKLIVAATGPMACGKTRIISIVRELLQQDGWRLKKSYQLSGDDEGMDIFFAEKVTPKHSPRKRKGGAS